MMVLTGSYFLMYSLFVAVGMIGVRRHVAKERTYADDASDFSLNDITVVIPFRNEEQRIQGLLASIQYSESLPHEFLFVDDSSDDASVTLISNSLKGISFQVLQSKGIGKKMAIQSGVSSAKTNYILTFDADVQFAPDYFTQLNRLKPLDMHILPVRMHSKSWKNLFEMDVYMVNSLNLIANGFFRPITASGANLLFRKSTYEAVHSLSHHQHIASGDDQFLLSDFNQHNKSIALHTTAKLSVTTAVPQSLNEFISQRLRWIQKTPHVKDPLAMKMGVIQVMMTCLFLGIMLVSICQLNWKMTVIVVIFKTLLDLLLVFTYFKNSKKSRLLSLLPIYEILFPFYTVLLAFLSLFYTPKWKGR
jgi:biofilm PGA synthesis N-glycosyltransferase PgaC